MSDDALSRAARALRETREGTSTAAGASRSRMLALAVTQRRRRVRRTAALVPLAAVLVLSTAWAAATGRVKHFVDGLLGGAPTPTHAAPAPGPPPSAPVAPAASSGPDAPEGGADLPTVDVGSLPVAPRPSIATATARPAAIVDAADDEDDLYAVAHRAHFVSRDPAGALKAWDAYLAAYPRGRFALEARYNRALSLVRLGRAREARDALAPFADGRLGGYRQREARELLEVLDGGGP